jgi:hypothetical protein
MKNASHFLCRALLVLKLLSFVIHSITMGAFAYVVFGKDLSLLCRTVELQVATRGCEDFVR